MKANKLSLDLTNNADLRNYFSGMQPGDQVSLYVTATIDELPGQFVNLSVGEAEVESTDADTPEMEVAERAAAMAPDTGLTHGSEYEPMTFPPEPAYAL